MLQVQKWVNQKTCVVAEGETQLDVFKQLASMQEVFGEEKCGKCGSEDVLYRVREAVDGKDTYEYPEMQCKSCWAKLSFGTMKGSFDLFPIRFLREGKEYIRDDKGNFVPKGKSGWVVYNKTTGKEE